MTKKTAYVYHRYGKYHSDGRVGKMKTKCKGKTNEVSTKKALTDKLRYVQTRFCNENNTLYADKDSSFTSYQEAWDYIEGEALRMAAEKTKGRSRETSFIFDSTINTGDERLLSIDDLHIMANEFVKKLRESGYKISKPVYCIHDNGNHRHIHIMFVSNKTIQKSTNGPMRTYVRKLAEKQKALSIQRERARTI